MFNSLNKGAYSFLLAIAIVIICVVLVGGIAIWKYLEASKEKEVIPKQNEKMFSEKPAEKPPKPVSEPGTNSEPNSEEKITRWETYRGSGKLNSPQGTEYSYEYEIEYPSNWKLFTSGPVLEWEVFNPGQIIIVNWAEEEVAKSRLEIIPIKSNMSSKRDLQFLYQLSRFGSALENLKLDSEDDMTFNGYPAKKLVYTPNNPEIFYSKITYLIQKGEIIYDLTLKTSKLQEINETFNQMLSSFKF